MKPFVTISFFNSESKALFDELTEMFSQDQNQKIFREILMKVRVFWFVLYRKVLHLFKFYQSLNFRF